MSALSRRIAVALSAVAAAGTLAACSNPGQAGRGATGVAPTPDQSTGTPTTSRSGGQGSSPGSSGGQGQGAGADCTIDHLTVAAKHGASGSGHRSMVLVFTNTGQRVCRLFGYPGVAALNSAGAQIEQAARTLRGYLGGLAAGSTPQTLFLSPGESASAIVEALAFNASNGNACTAYAALLVTAPNEIHSVRVAWDNDGCSDLQVHPVVLGTSGQGS